MKTRKKMPAPQGETGATGDKLETKQLRQIDITPDGFLPAIKTFCIHHLSRWFYEDRSDLAVKLALCVWVRFGERLVNL